MSKRFLPVLLVLLIAGVLITFGVFGNSEKRISDPEERYQMVLKNVGFVLEQGHYSPKKIDDNFSEEVLENYLNSLDPDKIVFLKGDINDFQKYKNRIDNEIHGDKLESFYTISKAYLQRFGELENLYEKALTSPIDLHKVEFLQADPDKRDYPSTADERYDYARRKMKHQVLVRFTDLMERNDTLTAGSRKTDADILKEASERVLKQIKRNFATSKNHMTEDDLFSSFVNAITGTMDPHTTYMAPIEKRTFDENLSGVFYGIGAQLQEVDGQIKIASLVAGSPAWKSGEIKPEDIIIKVGQGANAPVDVTDYALEDAVKLIRGEKEGSEVRLTLKRTDGTIKVVSLLRAQITLDAVFAKSFIIQDENKVGYIRLPEFYANFDNPSGRRSGVDVANEVQKLKDVGVDGIVIDLRGNGGGSLQDVIDMVGIFVKKGPVVQVRGRDDETDVLGSSDREPLYTGPLAVMVDEFSASASEIFAAAIQDYQRGVIIGNNTFGKGTVQRNVSLNPNLPNFFNRKSQPRLGDVKLTFKKFYRIDGGTTQLRGVAPDVLLPDRYEDLKIREKDNPDALGWDTIPKASYSLWDPGYSFSNIVSNTNSEVKNNQQFTEIRSLANSIYNLSGDEIPLDLSGFKKMQEKSRQFSKELNTASVLKKKLDISMLAVDSAEVGDDTLKLAGYTFIRDMVKDDIYVNQTLSVINQMIGNRMIALKEGKLREP